MTNTNTVASKLFVGFVAIAMALFIVAPAKAATEAELQAQIDQLMATITALQAQMGQSSSTGGSSASVCPYAWTRSLSTGATGADVMALQKFLNADSATMIAASGVGSAGMESDYFGAMTAAAVSNFQVKYRDAILTPAGLVNPTGYFGPSTMAKANALCASAPAADDSSSDDSSDDSTSTTLEGGEGYVSTETLLDGAVTIDLGESEEVLGQTVTAEDSDVMVNRVDFNFDARPWLYFDEVNLLVDGEQVASLSGSGDFDEITSGSDYRARFSGLDIVIAEGDSADISVELVVLGSMSGTRSSDTVTVSMAANNLRFVDGADISDTAGQTGSAAVSFNDTFGTGSITATIGENSPQAGTIVLNETSRTTGETVVEFDVEASDSDVNVTDMVATFSATGNTVADTLYRASLYAGNTLLKTKTVAANSVTFSDLNYVIDQDDTQSFSIKVDVNRGDSLTLPATLTVVDVDVNGETGDYAAVTDTVTVGETHNLLVDGVTDDASSVAIVSSKQDDAGTAWKFTYTFDVTAYGTTYYISRDLATSSVVTSVTNGGSGDAVVTSVVVKSDATLVSADNAYRISKGQTATMTVEVYVGGASVAGTAYVSLDSIDYGTTSAAASGSTLELGGTEYESGSEYVSI